LQVGGLSISGRNYSGKITVRHKGSGKKKNFSQIDFVRNWSDKIAICIKINKDSNRTCFVSLIKYSNGTYSYILAANSLKPGSFVFSTLRPQLFSFKYKSGCNIILKYSHYTHTFFNLQINLFKYGQYARAGGTFCKIISVN